MPTRAEEVDVPYTPILNIVHVLQGTLSLIEKTEYPHKGHPAIEHVKSSLRNALAAIHELDALQEDAIARHLNAVMPSDSPKSKLETVDTTQLDKKL
jgi:hypothetical protein